MTEPPPEPRGLGATLKRWRTPLVLLPLLVLLGYSGAVGAQMLWGETRSSTAEPVVTCWDGSEATVDACPTPSGEAGLRWVFPSFRPASDSCREVVYENVSAGPFEYLCRVRLQGSTAEVRYSKRAGLERGLAYLSRRYEGVEPTEVARGSRIVYRDSEPRKNGDYELTVAYVDHPFSVTVSADNERRRDRVLRTSVDLRPAQYLSVRPPDED